MEDNKIIRLTIIKIIDSKRAISTEDAMEVFKIIDDALCNGKKALLDFSDVELLLSVFLNVAVGQLYSKYDSTFIDEHLVYENISEDDFSTLEKVIKRAKQYFSNKDDFDDSAKRHFPDAK